jgi:hypothetical protein
MKIPAIETRFEELDKYKKQDSCQCHIFLAGLRKSKVRLQAGYSLRLGPECLELGIRVLRRDALASVVK